MNSTDFLQKQENTNMGNCDNNMNTILLYMTLGISLTKFLVVEIRKTINKKKIEKNIKKDKIEIHHKLDSIMNKEIGSVQNLLTKNNADLENIRI